MVHLAHKTANDGTIGSAVAANSVREDHQGELSLGLSNRRMLHRQQPFSLAGWMRKAAALTLDQLAHDDLTCIAYRTVYTEAVMCAVLTRYAGIPWLLPIA